MKDLVSRCPIEEVMQILSGRWPTLLIYYLKQGTKRFSDLRRDNPTISHRMLALELRKLEDAGIVSRTEFGGYPLRVEYDLTAAGHALVPLIDALGAGGRRLRLGLTEKTVGVKSASPQRRSGLEGPSEETAVAMLVERFSLPAALSPAPSKRDAETVQFAQAALTSAKREGLRLAVRARYVALVVIGCLLLVINPAWEQLYYVALLGLFALIGWAQVRVGRVGVSWPELALLFCDLALLTCLIVVPNPFGASHRPVAMQYHFGNFIYFFVLLAGATLAYTWRTVIAVGVWTAALWIIGMVWVWWQPDRDPALTARIAAATGSDQRLFAMISPSEIVFHVRIQEIVVFMIVAMTLALAVRRSNDLLVRHAAVERERGNLARYFSPNVVAELSKQDEPLKQVRTQHVAVLFVDIVGFTTFADARSPQEVVRTLREFHGLMEQEVFRHSGTLDKYLGDGLMATFGTPFAGEHDASNALRCAQAMIAAADGWNDRRAASGEPPLHVSFGLHYGPVVLGDIGQTCLEFAVIGATVNVASRLEALTRTFDCALVASDDLVSQAKAELGDAAATFQSLEAREPRAVRGIQQPISIWTQPRGA